MCEPELVELDEFAQLLLPGDVLVFKTASLIGHVIRAFDASGFNHAAIVLEPGMIVHTKWPQGRQSCIEQLPFVAAIQQMGITSIAAHRAEGRGEEVVERAREFLAEAPTYGYDALFLTAVITDLSSQVSDHTEFPILSQIEWEMVLAAHFGLLGDGLVTCAEFAFRCLPPDLQAAFPRTGRSRPSSKSVQELPTYRAEINSELEAYEQQLAGDEADSGDYRWVLQVLPDLIRPELAEDLTDLCSPHIGGVLMAASYWVAERLVGHQMLDIPTLNRILDQVSGDKWVEAHAETLTPGDINRAVPPLVPVATWAQQPGTTATVMRA